MEDFTNIRRKGRAEKDDKWIKMFLKKSAFGSIATSVNNQPFLNSVLYDYDERNNCIYFHTAKKGRTRSNIDLNEKVCFMVSSLGRLLPGETAMEFSVEYESVVVFGSAAVIENNDESRAALEALMMKYFPHLKSGIDYREITEREIDITSTYKIQIEQWSGKRHIEDDNFPGAFNFENS